MRSLYSYPRRGFVMLPEIITGLTIVSVLISALAIALSAERRAEQKLSDQMVALREAEAALGRLQNGSQVSGDDIAGRVEAMKLNDGWVRVTVTVNHSSATLVGLMGGKP